MKKNNMDAAVKTGKIKSVDDGVLDEVIKKLSKDLRLPKVQTREGIELQGGIYVVRREPSRLSYQDKIATANFNESNPPTLDYHVSVPYVKGQLDLLRHTDTKIGEQLLQRLAAHDCDREQPLSEYARRMLKQTGDNETTHGLLVSIYDALELPDFSEVYKFIKGHISFR